MQLQEVDTRKTKNQCINPFPFTPKLHQKCPTALLSNKSWCINLYFITKVYLLFSLTRVFLSDHRKLKENALYSMTKSAWWESAYLWEAGTRALIKCRGRPITGSVIMLEQRSNFGLRRLAIHHLEKQEAGREINNKYISQCLDATDVLLGQAMESPCQRRWFWLAKDFG